MPPSRFRRWPMLKRDGQPPCIDKDRVKQLYLENPHYSWSDFCKAGGYNPRTKDNAGFPVTVWQQEWMNIQAKAVEESVIDQALTVKKFISTERLNFPRAWDDSAKSYKAMGDYLIRKALNDAAHDQTNAQAIIEGRVRPRLTITPSEFSSMAGAMKRIQDLHMCSLLIPQAEAYRSVVPIRDSDPEVLEAESEEQRLKAIEYSLVGGGTLDERKMTQILDKWVDQHVKEAEIAEDGPQQEAAPQAIDQLLDKPLTEIFEEEE